MTFEEIGNECEKMAKSCKGKEAVIFMMSNDAGNMHLCMGGDVATLFVGINKMIEKLCEETGKDYYEMLAFIAKTKTEIDILYKGESEG